MPLRRLFARRVQAQNCTRNDINDLPRTGSWTAFTAASIAACALVFSAGAQNVAHGYALGIASSEFRALVLAAASAGASVLGPFAWLAVFRGRGLGPRAAALLLAVGCLAYAAVCSLGFVAGSRDAAVSRSTIQSEQHQDRRAVAEAARAELSALAVIKTPTRAILERRRELAAMLSTPATSTAPAGKTDSQAAALAFYIRAAGWHVTNDAVGTWLNLGTVLFLELAAALGLSVAAALYPSTRRTAPEGTRTAGHVQRPDVPAKPETAASAPAAQRQRDKDDEPPPPKPPRRPGRPATVLASQAVERLRAAGGRANGSIQGVGKLIGTRSKTAAHRMLHQLAAAGMVRLATGPDGVRVALA